MKRSEYYKKYYPHLATILMEMFKRVGAKFDGFQFRNKWFMKYEWTEKEQESFERWMIDYLGKNRDAIRELSNRPFVSTKDIKSFVGDFTLRSGWKLKEEKKK